MTAFITVFMSYCLRRRDSKSYTLTLNFPLIINKKNPYLIFVTHDRATARGFSLPDVTVRYFCSTLSRPVPAGISVNLSTWDYIKRHSKGSRRQELQPFRVYIYFLLRWHKIHLDCDWTLLKHESHGELFKEYGYFSTWKIRRKPKQHGMCVGGVTYLRSNGVIDFLRMQSVIKPQLISRILLFTVDGEKLLSEPMLEYNQMDP